MSFEKPRSPDKKARLRSVLAAVGFFFAGATADAPSARAETTQPSIEWSAVSPERMALYRELYTLTATAELLLGDAEPVSSEDWAQQMQHVDDATILAAMGQVVVDMSDTQLRESIAELKEALEDAATIRRVG